MGRPHIHPTPLCSNDAGVICGRWNHIIPSHIPGLALPSNCLSFINLIIILASSLPPLSLPAQVLLRGRPSLDNADLGLPFIKLTPTVLRGGLVLSHFETTNESASLSSGKTVPSSSFLCCMLVMSPRKRGAMRSRTHDWTDKSTELDRERLRHFWGRGFGCS